MEFSFQTESEKQTKILASKLASLLQPGDIISLTGDLGAGKTCFTQGLAKGLGVKEHITSPTFNLIKEYQGTLPLYHFDVFRLEYVKEMFDLGFEDYFFGSGVSAIEWGDKVAALLPNDYLEIEFHRLTRDTHRKLIARPHGKTWETRVKKWLE